MTPKEHETLLTAIKSNFKKSQSEIKHCYYPNCKQKPIQSHSISKKRILEKISDDGIVLMPDVSTLLSTGKLVEIGVGQASTLKCFCHEHDQKIFAPIDDKDYTIGNKEQEFLFAFRAASREFLTKEAAVQSNLNWKNSPYISMNETEVLDEFNIGQQLSIKDQSKTQKIFIDTYEKQKFNILRTVCVTIDGAYPIAASASFNLETDIEGNVINNVLGPDYNTQMMPCFLTLFPQDHKTFCLISYFSRNRKAYAFLNDINDKNHQEKCIIISNLLVSYVENFAINPTYWQSFPDKNKFLDVLLSSVMPHASLIEDRNFNLFTNAECSNQTNVSALTH